MFFYDFQIYIKLLFKEKSTTNFRRNLFLKCKKEQACHLIFFF